MRSLVNRGLVVQTYTRILIFELLGEDELLFK